MKYTYNSLLGVGAVLLILQTTPTVAQPDSMAAPRAVVDGAGMETLSPEKQQVIDKLLQLTGAEQLADMMTNAFVQQIARNLKQRHPAINPLAFDLVQQEVDSVIQSKMVDNAALRNLSYPIYHKHLTLAELKELVRFYQSPVGKKFLEVMPVISQEGMFAAESLAQRLAPEIQRRVAQRLRQEGISLQPEPAMPSAPLAPQAPVAPKATGS